MARDDVRFVVIAPTRLLVNNLWIRELQKWGMDTKKNNIFSLDGSRAIEERRKFWRHASQYKWNIICTPQTFTNDFYRGFFDIDEFDVIHLDEAHHLLKKEFDKTGVNKSYGFLEHRTRPVSGTTIRSENSKVSGTAKLMNASILDDQRAVTQVVNTNKFVINDHLRTRFDAITAKLIGYYLSIINNFGSEKFGLNDIFGSLQNINYIIKKYKIPEESKAEFKSCCYQIAKLEYFRNQCFEDDIQGLLINVSDYYVRNQNGKVKKRIKKMVEIANILERKKYKKIVDIARQETGAGNNILIFTKTRRSAEEVSNFLRINGFRSGFIHGGIETDRPDIILEEMVKNRVQVLVMTSMMGGEGLNMQYFKAIIHLTPHSDGFTKMQLKGRIRGGNEYYITYQNTREMNRLNSEEETGEDYAFTAAKNDLDRKEKLKFKNIGDNVYILVDDATTLGECDIEISTNLKVKNLLELKDNASVIGQIGQTIANEYLKKQDLKAISVGEYLSDNLNGLDNSKKDFLLSLCNTALDVFIPSNDTLYEVKTTFSASTNLSQWQAELAKRGAALGYKINKLSIFLNKNGFVIAEKQVK